MTIRVQKFGGTSLQTPDGRAKVVGHIKKAVNQGVKVVVVVSALGRSPDPYATDTLLGLIGNATPCRERDLLMSCGETIAGVVLTDALRMNEIKAVTLTGAQAGIRTTGEFSQAEIEHVDTTRVLQELESHDAVVVAGFQGQAAGGEVTTIGRGGSDTTAAALGAAFNAEKVEIFTDVNGIMTADPRLVPAARQLPAVTYPDICNLANQGAKVIHPKAVEIAMKAAIPIHVRSTYSQAGGTVITAPGKGSFPEQSITGIAHVAGMDQISIRGRKDLEKVKPVVLEEIGKEGNSDGFTAATRAGLFLTLPEHYTNRIVSRLKTSKVRMQVVERCVRIAVVGNGMDDPALLSGMTAVLNEQGITILQSDTNDKTIRLVIRENDLRTAANVLHDTFCLSNSVKTGVR